MSEVRSDGILLHGELQLSKPHAGSLNTGSTGNGVFWPKMSELRTRRRALLQGSPQKGSQLEAPQSSSGFTHEVESGTRPHGAVAEEVQKRVLTKRALDMGKYQYRFPGGLCTLGLNICVTSIGRLLVSRGLRVISLAGEGKGDLKMGPVRLGR